MLSYITHTRANKHQSHYVYYCIFISVLCLYARCVHALMFVPSHVSDMCVCVQRLHIKKWSKRDEFEVTFQLGAVWHPSNVPCKIKEKTHSWIKARIVNSLEKATTNWLCNAKRKCWVSLPRNIKGPRWDAHLLREIFYLDAIAAVAPQQHYQTSRKSHIWNSVFLHFPFF